MARRPFGVLGVVVLSLLAAACGGGDDSATTTVAEEATTTTVAGDAASVTAALIAALAADDAGGPFTAESAECLAEGVIEAVGLERTVSLLNSAEYTSAGDPTPIFGQMTDDEVSLTLTAAEGCVDLESAVADTLAYYGYTADLSTCMGGALVTGGFGESVLESFLTGSDPTAETEFGGAYIDALSGECSSATYQLILDDLTSYYGLSSESSTCVADTFEQSANYAEVLTVWMGVTDSSVDSTAVSDQITEVLTGCLTADELETLGIETTTTTQG